MANYGQGAQGAVGGALGGAQLGSMIAPGIGTAIGGIAGGLLGGAAGLWGGEDPNDAKTRKMLEEYYKRSTNRGPVQMGPQQYGQTSTDIRNRQLSLADQLDAISRGQGPSLAEQQLRKATDRNVSQQAAFANSGKAGPMGAMQAMNNAGRLGATAAQDAGIQRIEESNRARELLGLNLHGIRGADESMSQFNAGQGNDMSQAQMWANLKARGMDDEAAMNAIRAMQGQNGKPGYGEQILAGGAGLFSMGASQRAASKAGAGSGGGYAYGGQGMGDNLINPWK